MKLTLRETIQMVLSLVGFFAGAATFVASSNDSVMAGGVVFGAASLLVFSYAWSSWRIRMRGLPGD